MNNIDSPEEGSIADSWNMLYVKYTSHSGHSPT
jgi:hypothetical protein